MQRQQAHSSLGPGPGIDGLDEGALKLLRILKPAGLSSMFKDARAQ